MIRSALVALLFALPIAARAAGMDVLSQEVVAEMQRSAAQAAALADATPAAAPAPAEEEHRFGGCSRGGNVCGDPAVSVSLIGYDLKAKTLSTGIMPGLGYELSFANRTWHRVGLGAYAAIRQESGRTDGMFSVQLSFARYVHLGIARDVISATQATPGVGRWIVLGGFGADVR